MTKSENNNDNCFINSNYNIQKNTEIPIGLNIFNNENKIKSEFITAIDSINENLNNILNNRPVSQEPVKYGELVIIGYNGQLSQETALNSNDYSNRRKSKYVLKRREQANGVKPSKSHNCKSNKEVDALMKDNVHAVTYTLSRNHTVVVQYVPDDKTDMFQIGRSSESSIDFIVLDTQPKGTNSNNSKCSKSSSSNNRCGSTQSTISRFACRIYVDRYPPYTARLYAAGFDTLKHIFLGEKATKWRNINGELDGVTTNGVLIMHPTEGFSSNSKSSEWMEVSVCGEVFNLDEARMAPRVNNNQTKVTNILKDGTLIDICGATFLWRSAEGLEKTPTKLFIEMHLENLNRSKPQCPVGFKTLVFPSTSPIPDYENIVDKSEKHQKNNKQLKNIDLNEVVDERIPMVYLECGHIHGQHNWGKSEKNNNDERECPLCRKIGPYVKLLVGLEPSFYCDIVDSDKESLSNLYAFRPCAHMASESTCKYWSKNLLPQSGSSGLCAICPFCAIPLSKDKPYIKLIIQDNIV